MTSSVISFLKQRRTQYALGKDLPISKDATIRLIEEAVRQAPSSFNSQSSRIVILFGAESEKLWNITRETLRKIVPADAFAPTDAKMNSFAAGAGTVLFFEDQETIKDLQQKFPLYADNFPTFSEHSSGMAQFAVWTSLASVGIGASLQHYSPLIDDEVAAQWNINPAWKMRAQMPFGANAAPFAEKTYIDDAERFKIFG
ncbi:nitroreductase family protein [Pseudochrobactrum sp. HB0163]|uniref:nitroreductase family protein n=1 Tax=Pseudochrobactrum sp. HB0163 TaxID=3450708 RepID=UPI003F6DF0F0